jgi:O-antigen/teichoic acid export membrane protein
VMLLKKFGFYSDFNRNIIILFTWTVIAQAVPLALSPILTRLYSPAEFGAFALFFAVTNILGIIATCRYELAIVLPREESEAVKVENLCYFISLSLGCVLMILAIVFYTPIAAIVEPRGLNARWIFLVPFSVTITGLSQTISYALNREKKFRQISVQKLTQTSTAGVTSIIFGLTNLTSIGLITSQLIGQATILIFLKRKLASLKFNFKDLKIYANRYKSFPLMNAPGALLNTFAASLPIFYLAKATSKTGIGYYGLIERTIGAPIALVSYAVSQVLLEEIASRNRNSLPIAGKVLELFRNLFLVGILPFTALYYFSEEIFAFIFGSAWAEAGRFASILSIGFFMRFIVSPLSVILISLDKIMPLLIWQIMYFCATAAVVLYCLTNETTTETFFFMFAVSDVVLYIIYFGIILYHVRDHSKR